MPEPKTADQIIGRFAPSPSGPLHIGSLIAALASFLDARANKGLWYVRMEDLDPPRESPEAAKDILQTLEQLQLEWDGAVLYQSQRHSAYKTALESLHDQGTTFHCSCSRQTIRANGGHHQGVCQPDPNIPNSVRCLSNTNPISFMDIFQGKQTQSSADIPDDFILKRKDGFYAYQLAVVVDDAYQNINRVIRGTDLMDSTPRQIYLQSLLGYSPMDYGHIPVIVNELGQKLSKQHFASPVDMSNPQGLLLTALTYLQQNPEPRLAEADIEDILDWAIAHWQVKPLQGLHNLQEIDSGL